MTPKPVGWRNQPARHALAAKGIETVHGRGHKAALPGRNQNPPVGSYFVDHFGDIVRFKGYQNLPPGISGEPHLNFEEFELDIYDEDMSKVGEIVTVQSLSGMNPIERADGERLLELRARVLEYREDPIMFAYVNAHDEIEQYITDLEKVPTITKANAHRVAEHYLDQLEKSDAPWTNVD